MSKSSPSRRESPSRARFRLGLARWAEVTLPAARYLRSGLRSAVSARQSRLRAHDAAAPPCAPATSSPPEPGAATPARSPRREKASQASPWGNRTSRVSDGASRSGGPTGPQTGGSKGPTSCRAVLSAAQPASPWFGQDDTSCRWPALTGGRRWQRWLSRAIAGRVSGMDAQGLRRLQGCWSAWLGPLGRSFDTRSVSRLGLGRSHTLGHARDKANLLGSFLLGLLATLAADRGRPDTRCTSASASAR